MKNRIIFLDYLRSLSIVLVFVSHIFKDQLLNVANGQYHLIFRATSKFIIDNGGELGVIVFFLVSGYIITNSILHEDTKTFLIKRFFRIYPVYIAAILMETAYNYMQYDYYTPLDILIPRIMLLGDVFNTPVALYGVEWTLRCEISFYLLIAIFRLLKMINHTHLLAMLYLIISITLFLLRPLPVSESFNNGSFSLFFPILFTGSLIFLYEIKKIDFSLLIFVNAIIIILFAINTVKIRPDSLNSMQIFYGLIIFVTTWFFRKNFINNKIIEWFSNLTYIIYLFHFWTWHIIFEFTSKLFKSAKLSYLISTLMLLLICYVIRKAIEIPAINFGKKLIKNHNSTS